MYCAYFSELFFVAGRARNVYRHNGFAPRPVCARVLSLPLHIYRIIVPGIRLLLKYIKCASKNMCRLVRRGFFWSVGSVGRFVCTISSSMWPTVLVTILFSSLESCKAHQATSMHTSTPCRARQQAQNNYAMLQIHGEKIAGQNE